jgi:hypothetical protein
VVNLNPDEIEIMENDELLSWLDYPSKDTKFNCEIQNEAIKRGLL